MAQSGATTIQLYSSNVAGHVPTTANLVSGELALNYFEGKLYYKDSNNAIQILASSNAASGTFTNVTITGTATVNNAVVSNAVITNLASSNANITGGSISNVALTIDSIDSTPIGNTAPSTGCFTTISAANSIVIGANTTPISFLVNETDAIGVPVGTVAQRPTPATGYIRYNTDYNQFEGYSSGAWSQIGGGATGGGGDKVFVQNQTVVTTNYTLTTGFNAESVGPITINGGVTVTVPSGQRWVVL